ncbi:MAG: flavin reductase family protein [Bacteroidia bacterium]
MKSFEPQDLDLKERHQLLLGAVAPRPIAFASTIDKAGNPNLSPFSFFNIFSSNPPTLIFSPARRGRDNTVKHTLENVMEVPEVVVNIVSYSILNQMVLTSTEYDRDVNEFERSALTPIDSIKVKPFRVKEAKAQLECVVKDIIHLGKEGGAGNLVICEVVYVHIDESVLKENGRIDPVKMDQVARLAEGYYCRVSEGIFEVAPPRGTNNLGMDGLPAWIRESRHFTANELARLAKATHLPSEAEVEMVRHSTGMKEIYEKYGHDGVMLESKLHNLAKNLIAEGKEDEALRILMSNK